MDLTDYPHITRITRTGSEEPNMNDHIDTFKNKATRFFNNHLSDKEKLMETAKTAGKLAVEHRQDIASVAIGIVIMDTAGAASAAASFSAYLVAKEGGLI